jgi:hypothetical protein
MTEVVLVAIMRDDVGITEEEEVEVDTTVD